ncbi:hypothetical protein Ac2012v2_007322 [Leucoagaricus gongylophorus]
MSSLIIDSYINLPQAVLEVLDEGQPVFNRVAIVSASDKDTSESSGPVPAGVNSALIVNNVREIHSSDHTCVYSAELDLPNTDELIDVVLKITKVSGPRNDALWREYQKYEELAEFQGRFLPRCYGLFQASLAKEAEDEEEREEGEERESDVVSCLVLEYGGDASAAELNKNTKEFNLSVIKALEELHSAGYTHGSIQPSNILNKQGAPVFIDLEFSKGEHKCERVASVMDSGFEKQSGDFGCSEIYHAVRKMDLWKKSDQSPSL